MYFIWLWFEKFLADFTAPQKRYSSKPPTLPQICREDKHVEHSLCDQIHCTPSDVVLYKVKVWYILIYNVIYNLKT